VRNLKFGIGRTTEIYYCYNGVGLIGLLGLIGLQFF